MTMTTMSNETQPGTSDGPTAGQSSSQPPRGSSTGAPAAQQQVARQPRGRGTLTRASVSPFALGPFGFMRRMFEDLEQLFGIGGLEPRAELAEGARASWFVPRVDVRNLGDQVVIHADLPGMSADDIALRITDDCLVLEGERKQEREHDEGGVWRMERSYGRFQRVIPLPEGADPESAEARFEDGVLEVTLRAPERTRGREIPIKRAETPETTTARH
jgi:HSP20 family protein